MEEKREYKRISLERVLLLERTHTIKTKKKRFILCVVLYSLLFDSFKLYLPQWRNNEKTKTDRIR